VNSLSRQISLFITVLNIDANSWFGFFSILFDSLERPSSVLKASCCLYHAFVYAPEKSRESITGMPQNNYAYQGGIEDVN